MERMLSCVKVMDPNQTLAFSFKHFLDTGQQLSNEKRLENSTVVHAVLTMNLPRHLVLEVAQRRIQTHGTDYGDIRDLVADLFVSEDEVPMETNQLEDALMMSTVVVREALRKGVPPHLIKPQLRAKILSNGVGYTDVTELLSDLKAT